ncbi:hypothetical protein [Streptomyces brasiliensis]|uniref:Uncharacterized protein n=1 Tax=Streptomyces brasiliensis TaxID=1954 RepID=A0A917NK70_9ACTN|nr:hypothetical protein [Streptomyces brasiliensis]GGJ06806.1 hypothetical protein GCM10010121_016590 [Streptomyces brasiliensis]
MPWCADGEACSATKAAVWSKTNSLRLELQPRGRAVTGLHMGYVDTDMTTDTDAPRANAHDIAVAALDGVGTGAHEVLADDLTRWVKSRLSSEVSALYEQLAR